MLGALLRGPAGAASLLKVFNGNVVGVVRAASRHEIYVAANAELSVLDAINFAVLRTYTEADGITGLRLSADERQLFVAHYFENRLAIIDLDSGTLSEVSRASGVPNPALATARLNDGRYVIGTQVVSIADDYQSSVTTSVPGRVLATDIEHGYLYLVAAGELRKIDLNDAALPVLARHRSAASSAVLLDDGQRLVTNEQVYATSDLQLLGDFKGNDAFAVDAAHNRLYTMRGSYNLSVQTLDTLAPLGDYRYDCKINYIATRNLILPDPVTGAYS